jgi:hypothetical protein
VSPSLSSHQSSTCLAGVYPFSSRPRVPHAAGGMLQERGQNLEGQFVIACRAPLCTHVAHKHVREGIGGFSSKARPLQAAGGPIGFRAPTFPCLPGPIHDSETV